MKVMSDDDPDWKWHMCIALELVSSLTPRAWGVCSFLGVIWKQPY